MLSTFYLLLAFFISLATIPLFVSIVKKVTFAVKQKNRRPTKKMRLIKEYFEGYFSHWEIELSVTIFNKRLNGYIHDDSGWLIQYCFGIEDGLEYMDFYAYHNMTNDRHIRIYENGEAKDLPAYCSGYVLDDDGSGKRAYKKHNAEVTKSLIDKGFDQFTINMAISAGITEKHTETQYEIWAADYFDYKDIEWSCHAVYADKEQAEAELQKLRRDAGGEQSLVKFRLQEREVEK